MSMTRYLVLCLVLVWSTGGQVLAHSMLQASSPMDGAEVEAPKVLTLEFSEPVRLLRVTLTGPDGDAIGFGFEPAREPTAILEYDLPALEAGEYTVEWMLIGKDGHTVSDRFSFSVSASGA